ncbi:retrotransposon protein, partial [Genlisea aurea]
IFLGILAHHTKVRLQKRDYERSTWSVSKHFYSILRIVLRLQQQFLVSPVPVTPENATSRFLPFQNCLGALDGSYIPVHVKNSEKPRYRNRKGFISTNVLGVYDQNMNFVYVLAGWEGSAADSRVLCDALQREDGLHVPTGKCNYYLCDGGYMNCDGFLAPYRGVRYHLKEWGPGMQAPQNAKEYFNMKHASARNVIERAWGVIKSRRAILRIPFYPIRTQTAIMLTCELLHNFVRLDVDADPVEEDVDEDFEDNTETNRADDASEYVGAPTSNSEWTRHRDEMALEMYGAY